MVGPVNPGGPAQVVVGEGFSSLMELIKAVLPFLQFGESEQTQGHLSLGVSSGILLTGDAVPVTTNHTVVLLVEQQLWQCGRVTAQYSSLADLDLASVPDWR